MLAAKQDGNLTAAATWALVDPTSLLDTEGSQIILTTAYTLTNTFTPGAITIDGIALKVQNRNGAVGTITVALDQGGADVAGTVVTLNVSDLPAAVSAMGWVFFKFAAPVTLLAATAYSVKAKTSTANQVTPYRSAGTNYARYLRTTTAQAPAAGDMLCVTGEYTGAGTSNLRTVTMDDAAAGATVYGQVDVCSKGTLQYGTAAGVNYHLKLAGNLNVNAGGTFNIGTSGTPVSSDSTAVLEFNCASNVQYGLELKNGSTCNMRGATKTVKAFLAADVAAGATSLTTDVSTGWKSGDEIGIASTTRTAGECERRTLGVDASGTTVTVPALTNAHGGVAPVRAEVINLTRNVKVRGASASLQAYVNLATTAVVDCQYAEFSWLGAATTGKRGIDVLTTTGSCAIQNCVLRDFAVSQSRGCNISGSASNNITFSGNVLYNIESVHLVLAATTGTSITVNDNCAMVGGNGGAVFSIADAGITFTNNMAAGSITVGIVISEAAAVTGTFGGNVAHSNASMGVQLSNLAGGSLGSITAWRNTTHGAQFDSTKNLTIDTLTAFGNSTAGGGVQLQNTNVNLTIKTFVSYGGTTLVQQAGVRIDGNTYNLLVESGVFGSPSANATADVICTAGLYVTASFHNTLMASPTEVSGPTGLAPGSRIGSQRHDQTAGNHRSWLREGTVVIDTTIADVSASERLTPAIATEKLKSGRLRVAVLNGQTVTFNVKVRKSAAGDGTAYNGSQPRLMLEKNVAAGVAADTVLATAAAAAGQWETLQGTTPAAQGNTVFTFYVDCDGTQGFVNVDTAGAS